MVSGGGGMIEGPPLCTGVSLSLSLSQRPPQKINNNNNGHLNKY
jgi:hypothetical protein